MRPSDLSEITLGLLPSIVMAPVLRAAGTKRGLPFVLSADNISAREALDIGLVSRAELESATTALARRVAGWSPAAVAIAKEAASRIQDMEYAKALRYLRELTTLVFLSDDAREGIAAFFDKRPPEWKGR
jgi:enoyl-CoA hydratase/carnithine racemase